MDLGCPMEARVRRLELLASAIWNVVASEEKIEMTIGEAANRVVADVLARQISRKHGDLTHHADG